MVVLQPGQIFCPIFSYHSRTVKFAIMNQDQLAQAPTLVRNLYMGHVATAAADCVFCPREAPMRRIKLWFCILFLLCFFVTQQMIKCSNYYQQQLFTTRSEILPVTSVGLTMRLNACTRLLIHAARAAGAENSNSYDNAPCSNSHYLNITKNTPFTKGT